MKYLITLAFILLTSVVSAQECEGSPDFCREFSLVQEKLKRTESDLQVFKHEAEVLNESLVANTSHVAEEIGGQTAKVAAMAAAIAVFLRSLLNFLQSAEKIPSSPKAKAWMKVSTLFVGFLIFIASSLGMGMPWWQAIILAGGGPGSILVNELAKVLPIILNQSKPELPAEPPTPEV